MSNTERELIETIANCLVMGRGIYATPEAFAEAILKRLRHDGWELRRATHDRAR